MYGDLLMYPTGHVDSLYFIGKRLVKHNVTMNHHAKGIMQIKMAQIL